MHTNHRNRLREKALKNIDALNDYELLELILFSAKPRVNTNDTAHLLLEAFGSIKGVLEADPKSLAEIQGVGPQTASYITTLNQVIKRYSDVKDKAKMQIFSYNTFKPKLIELFKPCTTEVFVAYFLNKNLEVVGKHAVGNLSTVEVVINLEKIAKLVVLNKPHAVVIAHNHLSGINQPSHNDDVTTEKLMLLLDLNGVQLVDHIIVTKDTAFSYFHSGRLDQIKQKLKTIL